MKTDLEDGWRSFVQLCTKTKDQQQLKELFDLFLTIEEKENLAMRYLIIKDLLEGQKTQRELAADLGVSISKITRGSNALKIITSPLRGFLEKKMT